MNFIDAECARAVKLFNTKHQPGFSNRLAFGDGFAQQLIAQDCRCYYCETSILDIRALIELGLLKTRATGYGQRGPVLEVDKKENHIGYSPDNCVLACYYCNNDKSYTLDAVTYKQFFGRNRKLFFQYLTAGEQIS